MSTSLPPGPLATMHRRRPELFPDSEIRKASLVQHDVLDRYLETLTRRKQEYEFEHFARPVVEQEDQGSQHTSGKFQRPMADNPVLSLSKGA